ncbi:hypothetical protein B566_EDAN015550 [Ephemera danica]|nr:hypothetical protein B566_EDAN015550 [Ephemera danica]
MLKMLKSLTHHFPSVHKQREVSTCSQKTPGARTMAFQEDSSSTSATIKNTETWEKNKKFTVYKVVVNSGSGTWFIFRRYNEFTKLYEIAKKQAPHLQLKMPGKKLFGNNMDPQFIETRREALDNFIQKVMKDERLVHTAEVREFFQLDQKHLAQPGDSELQVDDESASGGSNSSGGSSGSKDVHKEPSINLGPSERAQLKDILSQTGTMDLKNIDPEFTKEPVPTSVGQSQNGTALSASVKEADAAFEGFSYAPPLEEYN